MALHILIIMVMKKIFFFYLMAFAVPCLAFAQGVARKMVLSFPHEEDTTFIHVFMPETSLNTGKAIVDCPGGGYSHLSMENEGTTWANFFCQRGITFSVVQYRMPKGNREIPVSDAENAVKLLRDSAEQWGINPYDVGIMGFSAGGHLASTVATHAEFDGRPDFCILFYPVVTMGKKGQHEGSCRNFLGKDRDNEQIMKLYSNDLQVRRHLTPPTIIFLANDDTGVPPVSNGIAYYSAMRNAGNNCALHVYPQGGHGFGFRESFPYHEQMLSELEQWLRNLSTPSKEAVRVACVGNSITDGSGIDMAEKNGYPAQLQKKLGNNYHVRNFGVGARTLMNSGDRPYMKELAWRDVLAFNPNVVIVKLGTNDSKTDNWKFKKDFEADYQIMIDKLSSLPAKPRIFLAHPIKAFKTQWTITDSVIVNEVIPAIDRVAEKNGLEVIDLHNAIEDETLILSDGIHPNTKGAAKLAEVIAKAVLSEPIYKKTKKRTKTKK